MFHVGSIPGQSTESIESKIRARLSTQTAVITNNSIARKIAIRNIVGQFAGHERGRFGKSLMYLDSTSFHCIFIFVYFYIEAVGI